MRGAQAALTDWYPGRGDWASLHVAVGSCYRGLSRRVARIDLCFKRSLRVALTQGNSPAPGPVSLASHSPAQVWAEGEASVSPGLPVGRERPSFQMFCSVFLHPLLIFLWLGVVTQEQDYFKEQIADGNRWC